MIVASASMPILPAPHDKFDDGLFAQLALNILRYGWLGPYNELTLAKGPLYPLFLAASFVTGLPFLAVQTALYVAASLCLARAVGLLGQSAAIEFCCAVLLLLNPVLFEFDLLHVTREGIYVPLTMFVVALALLCHTPRDISVAARMLLAAATGGALWLTREEGIWIVPPLVFLAVARLLRVGWKVPRALLNEAILVAIIGGVATGCVEFVCVINQWQYGVADVSEFKQSEFISAWSALTRIGDGNHRRHVDVSKTGLAQAYHISPAAAELRPYMEGPGGAEFIQLSCDLDGITISPCDGEIRDAWMVWALRSAVAAAGHYRDAQEARNFYDRLAHEVDGACDDGRIQCKPATHSLVPALHWSDSMDIIRSGLRMVTEVVTLDGWWWRENKKGVWLLPQSPVSCLGSDTLSICRNGGWFFDIIHSTLFVWLPAWVVGGSNDDLDRAQQASAQLPTVHLAKAVIWGSYQIRLVMTALLPWLSAVGLVSFFGAGVLQFFHPGRDCIWMIASICIVVIASRIGLLAVLDVLIFYCERVVYFSPIYPFVLVFCVLAPASLWRSVRAG